MDNKTFSKNFYTQNNINDIMNSTSNIFLVHSPLFQSLNNDKRNKHSRNIEKYAHAGIHSLKHFPNVNLLKKISSSLSPTIEDKEKLTNYYKTTTDYNDYENNQSEKKLLFDKYKIINIPRINFNHPKKKNNDSTFRIIKPFFDSLTLANKVLNTNRQITQRINEMTNYFQIEKYNKDICQTERKKYLLKKMPKIQIKSLKNDDDLENFKKISKRRSSTLQEDQPEKKEKNTVSKIPMNLFRRMSFNGILASNTPGNKNISHKNKHHVNALISLLNIAHKPHALSQFTLNLIDNKVYLFGGLSTGYNNDVWCFDIIYKKWDKIKVVNNKYDEPVPRYGHSSIVIGNNLVIFGGEIPKNYFKTSEDLIVFNIDNKKFSYPRIKKGKISQRKGHISIAATSSMLIYGGINLDTNKIENSAYILNLNKMIFTSLDYIGDKLPYLTYHNAIIAHNFFHYTSNSFSFYKFPSGLPHHREQRIKIEGIYIFGGLDDKYEISNKLYIISIFRKPCIAFKPKIDGIPPEPRYNSKMIFIEDYDFIVITGGTGKNQRVFNDLMILNIESLNWIKPIYEPEDNFSPIWLTPRTEHEMFYNNGKIYILGGRDENNYCKMDFECVQFEITNF